MMMRSIGEVIAAHSYLLGDPEDPAWRAPWHEGVQPAALFVPPGHHNSSAVWEVLEWHTRGLSLAEAGAKVGVDDVTAARWLDYIGLTVGQPRKRRPVPDGFRKDWQTGRYKIAFLGWKYHAADHTIHAWGRQVDRLTAQRNAAYENAKNPLR